MKHAFQFCRHTKNRAGVTLIELMIFIAIMSIMASTLIPLLFSVTKSRQRQDAIALVEQNGAQVLQEIIHAVQSAERIISPPAGEQDVILVLQTDSEATNPTLIIRYSGSVLMVQGSTRRTLSSELVGVTGFVVENTSTAADRQSVLVSLDMSREIRINQPLVYESHFDAVINLHPDDVTTGDSCGCVDPFCDDTGTDDIYVWQVCIDGICIPYADFDCSVAS